MVIAAVAALVLPAGALAQFSAMDRQDGSNRFDLHTDFLLYDGLIGEGFYSRTELYGQGAYKGWGGYGRIAFSSLVLSAFDDVNALGNLEVGALVQFESSLMDLVVHVGVTIPTAASDADSALANQGAPFGRVTDLVLAFADKLAIRVGASVVLPANLLLLRVDGGVDLLIGLGDEAPAVDGDAGTETVGALFRLNVGLGLRYRLFGATAEYSAVAAVTGGSVDFRDESYFHTFALSLRLRTDWVQPYLAATIPLDVGSIGRIWVVSTGVGARF